MVDVRLGAKDATCAMPQASEEDAKRKGKHQTPNTSVAGIAALCTLDIEFLKILNFSHPLESPIVAVSNVLVPPELLLSLSVYTTPYLPRFPQS